MLRVLLALALVWLPWPALAQTPGMPGPGPVAPAPDGPAPLRIGEVVEPPPERGRLRAAGPPSAPFGIAPGAVQYGAGGIAPKEAAAGPRPAAPTLDRSFNGIDYSYSLPPDPVLAAGPDMLVLVTNGSVTFRGKVNGSLIASATLQDFFASVRASGESAFDPHVVYDAGSGRFFVSALGRIGNPTCTPGTCVSHFFLAVSKGSSPAGTGSGDWYFYGFDATLDGATATANWADFDGLGVDGSVVVLTANMFSFATGASQYAKIRILNKATLIAGGAATWVDFANLLDPGTGFESFTVQPALTFGSPGTFFLASVSSTLDSCDVIVWGIANAASSPTLSKVAVPAGGTCPEPPAAAQLGGGTPLDTGDTRMQAVVYRNGSLWAAHTLQMNFGSGNVSAIRWLQIDVSGWPATPTYVQDSTLGLDGVWYFYPAVMPDAAGNLGLVFARSSASEYGSAYYTGRLATAPLNTMQPVALLKAGAANYLLLDSSGLNRWGDYSGIALDPSDQSLWMLGEYAATATTWGTWVGNFTLSNPVPVMGSLSPASATAGSGGFTLTVNGSKFVSASVVQWNGSSRATTYVSASQLQAAITAADIASGGTAAVTVFSPAPGGGTSATATFTVNNPAPVMGSLSPTATGAGGAGFTLTVTGSGFVPSSVVQWNGSGRTTTFVSATELQAAITAGDIASGAAAAVTVVNAAPGGGTSAVATFTVNNPAPVLGSLAPATAVVGGAAFTLTVTGSGFVPTSVARWNGGSRTTTYVSPTQLQAAILAADIASVGSALVTVFNPAPAGGESGSATFTITPPTFVLTVTVRGSASGAVASSPAGISCPPTCSAAFAAGGVVTLTASAGSGASFKGWGGACSGTATECDVTMSAAQAVTATFSKVFTDATLIAGTTIVKAVHVSELREAVDTLRAQYGLAGFAWTDSTLSAGSTAAKAAHLTDLRTALAQAYASAGQTPPAYTDPSPVPGATAVKAAHVDELRAGVRALE